MGPKGVQEIHAPFHLRERDHKEVLMGMTGKGTCTWEKKGIMMVGS